MDAFVKKCQLRRFVCGSGEPPCYAPIYLSFAIWPFHELSWQIYALGGLYFFFAQRLVKEFLIFLPNSWEIFDFGPRLWQCRMRVKYQFFMHGARWLSYIVHQMLIMLLC